MKPWLFVPNDWLRPSVKGTFQLYWCEESQLGCQFPIPEPDRLASFYEDENYYTHASDTESLETSSALSLWDRLRINLAWHMDRGKNISSDWMVRHFGSTPLSICEIGCGNGQLLEELQGMGHSVVGIEPDATARSLAVNERNLPVYAGTAEDIPPEIQSQRYDVIIMCHVLEHTIDPILALQNVMQLLAPQGKLVIETPNNAALSLTLSGITWFSLRVPEHLFFFTKDSLHGICKKVGLQIVSTQFSNYCRQFINRYIATEQQIWDCFRSQGYTQLPAKNSNWQAWLLLMRTIIAPDEQKYDCVRVIVEKN